MNFFIRDVKILHLSIFLSINNLKRKIYHDKEKYIKIKKNILHNIYLKEANF